MIVAGAHLGLHAGQGFAVLTGLERVPPETAYAAVNERWSGADGRLRRPSGFQVGWALNAARAIHGVPPVPTPNMLAFQ